MHSPYRSRSHIKKQRNNCKPKITVAERKKRKEQKGLSQLFPGLPFYWLTRKHKSIYQHSLTKKPALRK